MADAPRVFVIGGGPAGLRAAHTLQKQGAAVTLLEAAPVLGGLASSFETEGTLIERYYHFVCRGDDDLEETLDELGLGHKLKWRGSRMAYFVDGTLYPFLTPLELLAFRPLSFLDRLRAGIALKLCQRMKERDIASKTAPEWLRQMFGERAYQVIWAPLMRFKFAGFAEQISAAWIWARMVRLSRSRKSAWREELGYIEGGSKTVLDGLASAFQQAGGALEIGAPVEQIVMEGGRVTGLRVGGETRPADAVISTITTSRFRKLADGLDADYVKALEEIPTIGIFCLFLRLNRAVTPYFWVNTNDPRVPFAGMIEYTNLNPMPQLGGDKVLYVPQYLPADDPRYDQKDEDVLASYCDALALINPEFEPGWVESWSVFRDRFAQPICRTDYLETTPSIQTPVDNLFLTDSCQLHPHDRTISGSFSIGREAARLAALRLGLGAERA